MADFDKTQKNLQLSLDLDEQLTWGELFRFADMARAVGVDPLGPVGSEGDTDPFRDDRCDHIVKLLLYVEPSQIHLVPDDASSLRT